MPIDANLVNAFRGFSLPGIDQARQKNALGQLDLQREQMKVGGMMNPNATPEQLARSGNVQEATAITNIQQNRLENAKRVVGSGLLAITQSQTPGATARQVFSSPGFGAAAEAVGMPHPTQVDNFDGPDEQIKSQTAQLLSMLGLSPPDYSLGKDQARFSGVNNQQIAQGPEGSANSTNMTGSLQELAMINADRAARGVPAMRPEEYLSQRRGSSADSQLYAQYVQGLPPGRQLLPMDQFLRQFRGDVAGATTTAEEAAKTGAIPGQVAARTQSERFATQIDEGYKAADSLPILNKSIELLDSVKTGGLAAAQLAFTNYLGITGADEGQLSANVGKAVLSQLRTTFGAQFTQVEGERLASIESGFGKSTAVNRRLLGQAKVLVERVANRGINAANQTRNSYDADGIRKAMTLSVDTTSMAPPASGGWKIERVQ